jgi:hypothetical protein
VAGLIVGVVIDLFLWFLLRLRWRWWLLLFRPFSSFRILRAWLTPALATFVKELASNGVLAIGTLACFTAALPILALATLIGLQDLVASNA